MLEILGLLLGFVLGCIDTDGSIDGLAEILGLKLGTDDGIDE